jgi:hypothetical protein
MEQIQKFVFNNTEVDFQFDRESNVMVNATQMAKIFEKRVDVFLKSDHAKEFINVLEFTPFGGNSEPLKMDEIIKTKGQSGTWMHRLLALKFAAWLDPKFEVWVYSTIDFILFDYYKRLEESLKESAKRKNRIDELKNTLLENPDFAELEQLELTEKQASYARTKQNRNQLEMFRNS